MKKYLIKESGSFYKANLHCHSNLSDGCHSPADLKGIFLERGYSILAITDHNLMIPHPELCDENFIALTAVEYDIGNTNKTSLASADCCHFNFIALDKSMKTHPFNHRTKYVPDRYASSRQYISFDESLPDFEREYSPECVSYMMRWGRENNFFVTYNHPAWSQESYDNYIHYDGMHAMEIMNTISNTGTGIYDYNDHEYDDMLRAGKRIYCIAADDCHGKFPLGHPKCDIAKSYTMIKADSLTYESVAESLKSGDFYSSEGPVLNSIWYEDDKLCVECEPCERVIFTTYPCRGNAVFDETGDGLTYAEHIFKGTEEIIRVTLVDKFGKRAYTNAFFIDEIKKN